MNRSASARIGDALWNLDQIDTTLTDYNVTEAVVVARRKLREVASGGSSTGTIRTGATDSLSKLLADMGKAVADAPTYPFYVRLKAMVENDGVEPENPDVVNGEDAQSLPIGSIVVRSERDGTLRTDAYSPRLVTKYDKPAAKSPTAYYRVLYRAPVPPLAVGEEITTEDRLEQAKPGTVIRFPAFPYGVYRRSEVDEGWVGVGSTGLVPSRMLRAEQKPVVLYVPEGN